MEPRPRPPRPNQLNDLSNREWLLFQKSWFVHNPPPRGKDVLLHPAKFPETMIAEFISFFTKRGQVVLDPMAGTGSTLVAALACGRVGLGVELTERYASVARERLSAELASLDAAEREPLSASRVLTADARTLASLGLPPVDYCITSPPYWDMLRRQGFETQAKRRTTDGLDVHYSDDDRDLGNIEDYDEFMALLLEVYRQVGAMLRPRAYLTIIVKNVKKGGRLYPLAWDLGREVGNFLTLKDEKIWCQDNQKLAPYGMGSAWVSNTMHHYCLNFRKEA